jgi:cytoskeleton protein RodZ
VSTGIGDALRAAREAQGLSLDEAAADLRARPEQLRALEEERFTSFGGDVYAKGFLKNYAVELGIDPKPLLDAFRREVSHDEAHGSGFVGGVAKPPKERGAPPTWIVWLLAGVVIIAGFAFLSMVGSGVAPPTSQPDEPIGAPPASAGADDATEDGAPADDEAQTGEQATEAPADATGTVDDEPDEDPAEATEPEVEETEPPEPEGVELLVALEEASWMRVVIDGTPVLETIVPEGEVRQYRAEEEIEIRFGNPGGVRVELNGDDLGPQGTRGIPITLRYTVEGVEEA